MPTEVWNEVPQLLPHEKVQHCIPHLLLVHRNEQKWRKDMRGHEMFVICFLTNKKKKKFTLMLSLTSFQTHLTMGHKRGWMDGCIILYYMKSSDKYILQHFFLLGFTEESWVNLPLLFKQSACSFLVSACSLYKNQTFESMIHTQCWVMAVSQGENKLVRQQAARRPGMVLASHSVSNRLAWQLISSYLKECVPSSTLNDSTVWIVYG